MITETQEQSKIVKIKSAKWNFSPLLIFLDVNQFLDIQLSSPLNLRPPPDKTRQRIPLNRSFRPPFRYQMRGISVREEKIIFTQSSNFSWNKIFRECYRREKEPQHTGHIYNNITYNYTDIRWNKEGDIRRNYLCSAIRLCLWHIKL